MNVNTILDKYQLLEERNISDLNSYAYRLKHIKSGAKIVVLENDDMNKVFYIGFRTPPKNSTGVAHILEHSVLCGSELFPTKDPFADLCKSSLNTFLNAMTYPDKTVYPVASCNDKDFANLMHVYMDAVLKPNIYKEKKIFMQEGWHYELEDENQPIKINGVVYNEMKGAFSSADDVVAREIFNSLFPDTAYGVESGGDPENIPDLSYEEFLDFHKNYYHPSNSYIYLYGNADMEERLTWLDKEYLSNYDSISVDSFPGEQAPFEKIAEIEKNYPISDDENEKFHTFLSYNAVVGNALEREKRIAFDVIDYALCDAQGSPLKQALIDAGIGSEIVSSFDSGIYQPYYSIVAKNANPEDKSDFVEIIYSIINKIITDGFDKNALKAGLNSIEFKYRESDFGHTPKGLVLGLTAFDSWLYDENRPFDHIECNKTFKSLKEKIDSDYYEQLLKEVFIDSNHKSLVVVSPKKGLTAIKDKALEEKLANMKDSLSRDEVLEIVNITKALKEYQEAPDSKENLDKIPRLTRDDIGDKSQLPVNELTNIADVKYLRHNIFTNQIAYIKLLFKLPDMPVNEYSYYSLLLDILSSMNTSNYSFEQLGYEINKVSGGIHFGRYSSGKHDDSDDRRIYANIKLKTLYENLSDSISLVKEILLNSQLEDKKRLKELLAEIKSQNNSFLMNSGHLVAINRGQSYISKSYLAQEYIAGLDYCRFIADLSDNFDSKADDIIANLKKMLVIIFRKENLLIDVIADDEGFDLVKDNLKDFADCLYTGEYDINKSDINLEKLNEGITCSGMVQYVARVGNFVKHGLPYDASLRVLRTILSYDYLWTQVRIKGGAYGCMNNFNRNGNCYFVSYRDPNLKETNDVFKTVSDFVANFNADEDEITNYIIATIAQVDTPHTPSTLGEYSLAAYMTEVTDDMLIESRNKIINTKADDIRALSKYIDAFLSDDVICVVGNENKINDNSDVFANIIPLLDN